MIAIKSPKDLLQEMKEAQNNENIVVQLVDFKDTIIDINEREIDKGIDKEIDNEDN